MLTGWGAGSGTLVGRRGPDGPMRCHIKVDDLVGGRSYALRYGDPRGQPGRMVYIQRQRCTFRSQTNCVRSSVRGQTGGRRGKMSGRVCRTGCPSTLDRNAVSTEHSLYSSYWSLDPVSLQIFRFVRMSNGAARARTFSPCTHSQLPAAMTEWLRRGSSPRAKSPSFLPSFLLSFLPPLCSI